MAQLHVLMGADTIRARPTVRRIGLADLKDALARGFADFSAIPTHAVFLCLIYPIVGLVLARAILGYALLPLLFPLAALIFMYRRWKKHGDDPEFGAIVAQYESPEGLRPAEANAIMLQQSMPSDVAVTIVDLAVRGYVRIEEQLRSLGADVVRAESEAFGG